MHEPNHEVLAEFFFQSFLKPSTGTEEKQQTSGLVQMKTFQE